MCHQHREHLSNKYSKQFVSARAGKKRRGRKRRALASQHDSKRKEHRQPRVEWIDKTLINEVGRTDQPAVGHRMLKIGVRNAETVVAELVDRRLPRRIDDVEQVKRDPVAQTSYTLNLTEKTAQKMPGLPPLAGSSAGAAGATLTIRAIEGSGASLPPPDAMPTTMAAPAPGVFFEKHLITSEQDQGNMEDLGSQTMEGALVNGVRTTHTIPAGQIGNDRPITIVTEVWTSPDLKTVVYSKRSDPLMGEQTFHLTNIVRTEPNPSLFTVPADFKIVDGPQPIFYQTKQ